MNNMTLSDACPFCHNDNSTSSICSSCGFDIETYNYSNRAKQKLLLEEYKPPIKPPHIEFAAIDDQLLLDPVDHNKNEQESIQTPEQSSLEASIRTPDIKELESQKGVNHKVESQVDVLEMYRSLVKMAWADQKLEPGEICYLTEKAHLMNLTEEQKKTIELQVIGKSIVEVLYQQELINARKSIEPHQEKSPQQQQKNKATNQIIDEFKQPETAQNHQKREQIIQAAPIVKPKFEADLGNKLKKALRQKQQSELLQQQQKQQKLQSELQQQKELKYRGLYQLFVVSAFFGIWISTFKIIHTYFFNPEDERIMFLYLLIFMISSVYFSGRKGLIFYLFTFLICFSASWFLLFIPT